MGHGRILAVDDEPSLLRLLQLYLTRLGYEADACASAPEALACFAARPSQYRLVLADLAMPDMSGEELLLKMLELNPRIYILVLSGHPFNIASLPAGVQGQIGFLQKPFLPSMLAQAIEQLVNGRDVNTPW